MIYAIEIMSALAPLPLPPLPSPPFPFSPPLLPFHHSPLLLCLPHPSLPSPLSLLPSASLPPSLPPSLRPRPELGRGPVRCPARPPPPAPAPPPPRWCRCLLRLLGGADTQNGNNNNNDGDDGDDAAAAGPNPANKPSKLQRKQRRWSKRIECLARDRGLVVNIPFGAARGESQTGSAPGGVKHQNCCCFQAADRVP